MAHLAAAAVQQRRGGSRGGGRGGRGRGRGSGRGRGRGGRHNDTTTHLPPTMLTELDTAEKDTRQFAGRVKNKVTVRKKQRKQQRLEKKQRRASAYTNKRGYEETMSSGEEDAPSTLPSQPVAVEEAPNKKKLKKTQKQKEPKPTATEETEADRMRRQIAHMAATDPDMYARLRASGLLEGNAELDRQTSHTADADAGAQEDRLMRYYEKKLGMKRRQPKLPKSFTDDGLDFLLDDLTQAAPSEDDDLDSARPVSGESDSDDLDSDEDEDEIDEAADEMGSELSESFSHSEEGEEDSEDDEDDSEEDDDLMDDESVINEDEQFSDTDNGESAEDTTEDEAATEMNNDDEKQTTDAGDQASASSSAALSTTGQKYVPPHLRGQPDTRGVQLLKLRRQLQGQLNRLSESNTETILCEIEDIYRQNPRHDVTESLTEIILNAVALKANLSDNFVVVNAALVAALYSSIGIEFGAHMVQTLMERFERYHHQLAGQSIRSASTEAVDDQKEEEANEEKEEDAGKECSNLTILLTELYNFNVISHALMYDLVRWFISDITEYNVELLTKVIRLSGTQLRQEDPAALKDIVMELHTQVAKLDPRQLSSRTKFMIEMIQDLKNNKIKKRTTQATQASATRDVVTLLKKWVGNRNRKHHVSTSEALNVTLEDIRSVKTKGKWWLVGASWVGQQVGTERGATVAPSSTSKPVAGTSTDALLALARKQNMNTDVRRSIFVILMSSEDYVDAFDRLMKLGLKEVQEREIPRVLLHCCGQEKAFNPYYALVAEKVCNYKHSFKVTFQYALWDFLRELGEVDVGGLGEDQSARRQAAADSDADSVPITRLVHLAKFYGWLIGSQCLSLIVLKTVTFTRLQTRAQTFFRVLLAQVFLRIREKSGRSKDADAVAEVFGTAMVVPALADGLRFFLHHFLRKKVDFLTDAGAQQTVRWSVDVAYKVLQRSSSHV